MVEGLGSWVVEAPGGRGRGVTLKDVARVAGVSIATASKALNGRADVRAETRSRVVAAAERLDFTPNALAQNLTSGRTGTVGLITHDLEGRFSLPILMGVEDAFGAGQMSVFLCDSRGDAIREAFHLRALLGRRVDGLVVVGSTTNPRESLGRDLPVPVVYVYAPSTDPEDLSVVPDNIDAGRQATQHLLDLGRRRIAHIAGDVGYDAARDRVIGVQQVLDEAGLDLVGPPLYGTWSEGWGRAASRTVLEQHPEVDAIVCGSDQIARGVLEGLRVAGRGVPEDIAVVSFDNWEILATGARPQLSSVDMRFEALGRTAAARLFEVLDGQDQSGVITQPGRLVVRGSTLAEV